MGVREFTGELDPVQEARPSVREFTGQLDDEGTSLWQRAKSAVGEAVETAGRGVLDAASAVRDDVSGALTRRDARRVDEMAARGNMASQTMRENLDRSGSARELHARAEADVNRRRHAEALGPKAVDMVRDLGVNVGRGTAGMVKSAVGLTAMPLDAVGALEPLEKVGVRFRDASRDLGNFDKWASGFLSDRGKADEAKLDAAKGFTESLLTLGTEPRLMMQEITKSLPGTLAAGKVGEAAVGVYGARFAAEAKNLGLVGDDAAQYITKAFQANADTITRAALIGAAAGEGMQSTGDIAAGAQAASRQFSDYALPAAVAGAATAGINVGSNKLANKLGIGDLETDIALRKTGITSGKTGPAFWVNRAAIEGIKEGAFEELPQSTQEAIMENIAMGRPWDTGIGKAAAMGLATGVGMGGGHAAVSGSRGGAGVDTVSDEGNPDQPQVTVSPVTPTLSAPTTKTSEDQRSEATATLRAELAQVLDDPRSMAEIEQAKQAEAEQPAQRAFLERQNDLDAHRAFDPLYQPPATSTAPVDVGSGLQVTAGNTRESSVAQPAPIPSVTDLQMPAVAPSERMPSITETPVADGSRLAPVPVETSRDVEHAAQQVELDPSLAQIEAGNYRKGHVQWSGLSIAIENPKGSIRSGSDADGTPWDVALPDHYGYIKRTTGNDGDQVDVYLGEDTGSKQVFIIDQIDAKTGAFDEHKVMLGYSSQDAAMEAYRKAFSDGRGGDRLGAVTPMPLAQFKTWLKNGKTHQPLTYVPPTKKQLEMRARATNVSGQTPVELAAAEAERERLERERTEAERKAEDAERKAREAREIASRQNIGAESFSLTAQVNDRNEQRRADQRTADNQLAGQGDIFGQASEPMPESSADSADYKYTQIQAVRYAGRMTAQGLPSKAVQSKSDPARWAIVPEGTAEDVKVDSSASLAPSQEKIVEAPQAERGLALESRAGYTRESFAANVLQELATEDELFRYPVSKASSLKAIFADVFPGVEWHGESTRADERDASGADHRYTLKTPDTPAKNGQPERIGKQFEVYTTDSGKVWIDVHRLQPGDLGSRIYAAVANYAYNNRKVFTGDPAGVSDDAVIARTKMMLASALRFGTTRHLEASSEQEKGKPEEGIEPLKWSGSDVDKTRALIHTFIATVQNQLPSIKGIRYDFEKRQFVKPDGTAIAAEKILDTVGESDAGRAGAGKASGRAAILVQSLISEEGRGIGDGGILEVVLNQSSSLVSESGGLKGLLSKTTPADAGVSVSGASSAHLKAIQAVVRDFKQRFKGASALTIRVVQTSDEIPVKYRPSPFADGVYHDDAGLVYLIASKIPDTGRATRILLHEAIGHYGLSAMMGERFQPILKGVLRAAHAKVALTDTVAESDPDYATVEAVRLSYPGESDEVIAQEVLARMAETGTGNQTLWRVTLARIRLWLNDLAKALGIDVEFTLQDARDLVTVAGEYVRSGKNLESAPEGQGLALASQAGRPTAPLTRASGFDRSSGMVIADFKNDQPLKRHSDYKAAKAGDIDAAARLVQALVKPESLAAAREAFGDDVIYLPVLAEEASGRNKIPLMLAHLYSDQAGGSIEVDVAQANRAYHTGANAMERLLARAEFTGSIKPGGRYVLVDDVTTMGSTLADLASYIQSQGGTVAGSVVLVNAMRDGKMLPSRRTVHELEVRHGDEIRKLFGIEPAALTDSEAGYLIGFRTTDELRNRLATARRERSERLRAKGLLPERQDSPGLESRPPPQTPPPGGVSVSGAPGNEVLRPTRRASQEADTSILDHVLGAKYLWTKTPLLKVWGKAFDLAEQAVEWATPEQVKAGLVSDYGLAEDYLDRKADMQAAEAAMARKTHGLIEMLAGLTRAESRVAFHWMQAKPDTRDAEELMAHLPEGSRETLKTLKALITDLGAEAVRLGLLPAEAYERHKDAYLHLTYAKHILANEGMVAKWRRTRAARIKGDQFKGRGVSDQIPMSLVRDAAPEWWQRKRVEGQADTSLIGQKLLRFNLRDMSGTVTDVLPGMTARAPGRIREIAFWPASEPVPAKFGNWEAAGEWEVRGTKGGDLLIHRPLTREEMFKLGELDEVRYAVAQTLQLMVHDVEVGRFFEWITREYARPNADGLNVVEAKERLDSAYSPDTWVEVPSSFIPGTRTRKYGALAGMYVPGPVWNDLRQIAHFQKGGFMSLYGPLLRFWKKSKTAWSPGVHTNNIMANFVMADWHDIRAADLVEALNVWARNKQPGYRELFNRFEDSGALGGMFASNELMRDEITKRLDEMKDELKGEIDSAEGEMTAMAKVLHLTALATRFPKAVAGALETAYQGEDVFFRLAVFLKAVRYGKSDREAGKMARHAFLNYEINAPWVQAARSTSLPFISFFYRALPMLVQTVREKPWKIIKLIAFWTLINALGVKMSGGDDDDEKERALMPKEKSGRIWGMVPKMIRMPWNSEDGAPIYLDIRRWVPVGDIADLEQGHGLPPPLVPSGPLVTLAEVFLFNKSLFTGKEISKDFKDLDTLADYREAATKKLDYLYKSMMPNVPVPNPLGYLLEQETGQFQSYAWAGIEKAYERKENTIGEVRSPGQAALNAVGVKVGSYPAQNLKAAIRFDAQGKVREINKEMQRINRDFNRLKEPTAADRRAKIQRLQEQQRKRDEVLAKARARMNPPKKKSVLGSIFADGD